MFDVSISHNNQLVFVFHQQRPVPGVDAELKV